MIPLRLHFLDKGNHAFRRRLKTRRTSSSHLACHYPKLRPDTRTSFDRSTICAIPTPDSVGRFIATKGVPKHEKGLLLAGKISTRRSRGGGAHKYRVAKRLSSAPSVSMVQAAHLGNRNDTTFLRSVNSARLRGVFLQG
jgi:hypothetical protein